MQHPLTCAGMQRPLTCTGMQHPLTCAGMQHPLTCTRTQSKRSIQCETGLTTYIFTERSVICVSAVCETRPLGHFTADRPITASDCHVFPQKTILNRRRVSNVIMTFYHPGVWFSMAPVVSVLALGMTPTRGVVFRSWFFTVLKLHSSNGVPSLISSPVFLDWMSILKSDCHTQPKPCHPNSVFLGEPWIHWKDAVSPTPGSAGWTPTLDPLGGSLTLDPLGVPWSVDPLGGSLAPGSTGGFSGPWIHWGLPDPGSTGGPRPWIQWGFPNPGSTGGFPDPGSNGA